MITARLSPREALLALAVVAVWGTNFVIIRIGLDDLPPLFFAALRFALAFLPAAVFLKRPAVSWGHMAAYGLFIGAGQFGLLFLAMRGDISPGLASLVVQMQVFFTIGLSVILARERIRGHQWVALVLGAAGILIIIALTDGTTTPLGLALVLAAGFSWSCGNLVVKRAQPPDMLAFVVWTSAFSVPPLLALSLVFEGPAAIQAGLARADWATWAVVAWQSVGNTIFGYGVWGWLLARHTAATVTPWALLVPVFGMGASALVLGEPLPPWKLEAAALMLAGLALNVGWPWWEARRAAAKA